MHHWLGVARTRCPSVNLVGELVLLMWRRAVLRLMRLWERASHRSHCIRVSRKTAQRVEKLTRYWWHLIHLRALRTRLHIHHGRLLVALLRPLVAHHRGTRPRAREPIGTRGHVAGILRVPRSLCIHLHLRLSGHAHKGSIRGLLLHHVSTHLWSRAANKLASLGATKCNMLNAGTHTILGHLHLLRVSRHWLGLCTIYVRRHLTW